MPLNTERGDPTHLELPGQWESLPARQLTPVTIGGDVLPDLAWLADAAVDRSGERVAVLDRMSKRITVLSSTGSVLLRFGIEGTGPGEFQDPVALERLGDTWIVWDRALHRISQFTLDGELLSTHSRSSFGDVATAMLRQPMLGIYSPFQGHIDFADRLGVLRDSAVVLEEEENELSLGADALPERDMYLLAFGLTDNHVDTLIRLPAPRLTAESQRFRGQAVGMVFEGPAVFSPRLVWTTGDSGRAWMLPATSEIFVATPGRKWSVNLPQATVEVQDEDLENLLEWSLTRWAPYLLTEEARTRYEDARERRAYIDRHKKQTSIASETNAVQEIHLDGGRLWLSGFSSSDTPEGISTVWTVVELQTGVLLGRIGLSSPGERLRDVRGCRAVTTSVDTAGLPIARIYDLPFSFCSA